MTSEKAAPPISSSAYAVFGNPIKHSKSPAIHTAFSEQFDDDITYRAVRVEVDEFELKVSRFFQRGGGGLNVTLPFKERAFAMADEATDRATRACAANCLIPLPDGRIRADNTDGIGMVRDILRFNEVAIEDLEAGRLQSGETLQNYLERHQFNEFFRRNYLISMASAIWSANFEESLNFPAEFFVRFFKNHGLLQVKNRPQWRVLKGGSKSYLSPLCAPFADSIRTSCEVVSIQREPNAPAKLRTREGEELIFDDIVIAAHADQALRLLSDADVKESAILSELPYSENEVVLHTDTNLLPKRQLAWSSWNYRLRDSNKRATLTYNMNILQGISSPETFCVTLNDTASIDPATILGEYRYAHPQFTIAGISAQERWQEINGPRNTWFCGAYWRNGFHEDGLFSGNRVADAILEKRGLSRTGLAA